MAATTHTSQRTFKQIPPEALEVIADVLLASAGRDNDRPAYNEDQLKKKRQRAVRAEEYFGIISAAGQAAPTVDDIDLAENERAVLRLFQEGYKASEIARILQITRPTAVRLLKSAARRISACRSRFAGIEEMHYHETHKRVYRKPVHCPEQPCRRLGYCKYALKGQIGDL